MTLMMPSCFHSCGLPEPSMVTLPMWKVLPHGPVSQALFGVFDVVTWPDLSNAKLLLPYKHISVPQTKHSVNPPPPWHFNHSQNEPLGLFSRYFDLTGGETWLGLTHWIKEYRADLLPSYMFYTTRSCMPLFIWRYSRTNRCHTVENVEYQ